MFPPLLAAHLGRIREEPRAMCTDPRDVCSASGIQHHVNLTAGCVFKLKVCFCRLHGFSTKKAPGSQCLDFKWMVSSGLESSDLPTSDKPAPMALRQLSMTQKSKARPQTKRRFLGVWERRFFWRPTNHQ